MSLTRTFYYEDTKVAELHSRVTPAERTAGTETEVTNFSPSDIKDMIDTHSSGGVGNLTFFSRDTDYSATTSFANVVSGSYTPGSTGELVGLLVSVGAATSTGSLGVRLKLRRGTTDITTDMRGAPVGGYSRQLFLDKPGSASAQTYALQVQRYGTLGTIYKGTSLSAFAMPAGVVADIITSDEDAAQNTNFLSVTITPSSASAKIKLNMVVISTVTALDMQLRRGTTELISVTSHPQIEHNDEHFPTNFEDWIDEPGTTSPVTYHLRKTNSGTHSIRTGSYLMAQEVA